MAQMWDRYINKNHTIYDASLVDYGMLHQAVSYDPNQIHINLYGKNNDKGVYHNYLTEDNMSIIQFYQVRKKIEVRHEQGQEKKGCSRISIELQGMQPK